MKMQYNHSGDWVGISFNIQQMSEQQINSLLKAKQCLLQAGITFDTGFSKKFYDWEFDYCLDGLVDVKLKKNQLDKEYTDCKNKDLFRCWAKIDTDKNNIDADSIALIMTIKCLLSQLGCKFGSDFNWCFNIKTGDECMQTTPDFINDDNIRAILENVEIYFYQIKEQNAPIFKINKFISQHTYFCQQVGKLIKINNELVPVGLQNKKLPIKLQFNNSISYYFNFDNDITVDSYQEYVYSSNNKIKIAHKIINAFDFDFFHLNKKKQREKELNELALSIIPSVFNKNFDFQEQIIIALNFHYKKDGVFEYCSQGLMRQMKNNKEENYNVIYESNNGKIQLVLKEQNKRKNTIDVSFLNIQDAVKIAYGNDLTQFLRDTKIIKR